MIFIPLTSYPVVYRCLPQSAVPSLSHLPSHLLPVPTLGLAPVSCLIYLHKKIVRTLLLSFSASSFWPLVIYSMKGRRCQWSSSVKHYSHTKKKNFKMAENLQKFRLDDTNEMRTLEVNPLRVIPTASPDVCLNINGFTPHSTTAQSPLANRGVQSATVHFLRGPWIVSSRTELQRGKQSHLRFAVNECKSQPIILLLTAREVTAILLPQRRFRLMNVNGEHK